MNIHVAGEECIISNYIDGPEQDWLVEIHGGGAAYWFSTPPYDRMWSSIQAAGYCYITNTLSNVTGEKKIFINGNLENSATSLGYTTRSSIKLAIGANRGGLGGHAYLGDIAEILVYDHVDAAQQAAVEQYLLDKYFIDMPEPTAPREITTLEYLTYSPEFVTQNETTLNPSEVGYLALDPVELSRLAWHGYVTNQPEPAGLYPRSAEA